MYLERLLGTTARLTLQLAVLELLDELVALGVSLAEEVALGAEQARSGRDIANADREASIHEKERGDASQSQHGTRRVLLAEVAQQQVEDVVLGAGAEDALVERAAHELAVVDDHVGVVGAHVLAARVILALGAQVESHAALAIRPQQQAEYLLACPQAHRFEDGRLGQVEAEIGVLVGAYAGEEATRRRSVEERVLERDQIGAREKVLRGGDDDLAVARRDQIRLAAHQNKTTTTTTTIFNEKHVYLYLSSQNKSKSRVAIQIIT